MIYIASDHRGFELKQKILKDHPDYLDLGPRAYDPEDDYNEFAANLAINVRDASNATQAADPPSFGILICGSAHGVAIEANRFKGIRAILGLTPELAKIGREHNNANVLCLSADFTPEGDIPKIIDVFLTTKTRTEEKYARRNIKLDKYGEN
ncbi:RpiB/LacA/LacB family sugar-phosphate isomerase [Candidatus Saccharibacteria bacterium]|nr:RpiB/LacA/LacB family sugar-phosphate isomerase [Candidatus Saccharibacteria bacterium]MBQ9017063.1 RpiB/LacA/LacB family sugar-phosphate isomerase [Candidatus Saccharibacteria bacterium]